MSAFVRQTTHQPNLRAPAPPSHASRFIRTVEVPPGRFTLGAPLPLPDGIADEATGPVRFFKGVVAEHEGDSVLCELWELPSSRELLVSFLVADHPALTEVAIGDRLRVWWWQPDPDDEAGQTYIESSPDD